LKGPLAKAAKVGGRYVIHEWIGAGGMQNVYLAKDELFGREVALKVPKEDAAVKRFQQSAVVSAKINHSNVAKTLDYVEEDENVYLIEELVVGVDLSKIMGAELPLLPPSACARLLHQLAKGLAASHHAGVVHRDLKPSNIMIVGGSTFSEAKITDFGIAKMAEGEIGGWADGDDKGSTSSKTVLGAIPYMSPESITDFKHATKPSDVWSIAAIIYELLSGKRPFGGGLSSIPKILEAKKPQRPAQIAALQFRGLGSEICEIIDTCLSKEPKDRPTADQLVSQCGQLCYSLDLYEIGRVSKRNNSYTGFIVADHGTDLMYHRDNFYGDASSAVGDRIWFGRHPGTGNDRAFPIVKLRVPAKPA
jgi:serine/threonine-protein kinase